jgi:Lrp/AsnC family transcriptional regulator for asnA, asnC and gidA
LVEINLLQVTGITNPLGVGFEAMAMIGVRTNGPAQGTADELAIWRDVSYVVIAMGRFDLLVEVVCVDRAHLLSVTERIRSLPTVVSTETFGYLNLVKQIVNWGVPIKDGHSAPM